MEPFAEPQEPLNLISLPAGITRKELQYIKLTSLFLARYGGFFFGELMNRVGMEGEFEFLKPTDSRFNFFSQFSDAYAAVGKHSGKPDTVPKVLVDGFFRLLQADGGFQGRQQEEEGMEMFDLGVLDYVANIGDKDCLPAGHLVSNPPPVPPALLQFPSKGRMQPTPPPPQKFGESTVKVLVQNASGGQVIEITEQSLVEDVASLKEKIAVETKIPANKQKLSGKAVFLEDNKSLAHYNLGAGETLILSM